MFEKSRHSPRVAGCERVILSFTLAAFAALLIGLDGIAIERSRALSCGVVVASFVIGNPRMT